MIEAISLEHLYFSYGQTPILQDVTISIKQCSFVGIFGPNGGGKTTLLKILMGFLVQDQGNIHILNHTPIAARHLIGYVPQSTKLDKKFPITVQEVVEMGLLSSLSPWGKLPKESKEKASIALEQMGLLDKRNHPFGTLSGGQTQRTLIARALASDPKILLLDEPTANVDPKAEQEIIEILCSLKEKITILMVTHDLQTILEHVSQLLCIHKTAHCLNPTEACEHFGLGLYHTPLIAKNRKGSLDDSLF